MHVGRKQGKALYTVAWMLLSICLGSLFIVQEHHEVSAVSTINMDISVGLEINNCLSRTHRVAYELMHKQNCAT